ncbi:50S ribosomal protein L29 [Anaerolineae bacterium CFX9]|jgi:large subunit ribosomal protein L29|nr:50S ribosomal protein L29 [Anaerolineae bacterium CFX9]
MKIREIRELNDEKLMDELEDQKEALFNLRFQEAFGQLDDATVIRKTRRTIARLLTVIRERELSRQNEGK